jgi:signal peptidase II
MDSSTGASPQHSTQKYALFSIVAVGLTILDQWTKYWIRQNIELNRGEIRLIDGYLSLVHTENRGAAFGIGAGSEHAMLVFGVFTVVAAVVLAQMLWQISATDRYQNIVVATIASGAVGNAIDRVHKQAVTDFIRVYAEEPPLRDWLMSVVSSNEWPSFNIADAAIVVGLGMFVIHYLFIQKDPVVTPDPPARPLDEPVKG